MKPITFSFLLFFSLGYSQIHQPKGEKDAFYVYNKKKDTLFFPKIDREGFGSLFFNVEDSIQIDNKENKEIILTINLDYVVSDHGGTFDILKRKKYLKYEIWNLDTKSKVFEFYKTYEHNYNEFDAYKKPEKSRGSQNFSCDFKFQGAEIIISNAKYSSEGDLVNNYSLNEIITSEGCYKYIDNKYQRLPNFKF